ncbi:hypothetical protein H4R18_005619 [Coemansia javaensis]|uniref:Ketoreductase domain-containing protein n=1 Tax=Coemansia javaensis TaxID=2761396 RepID=A0A9W8H107_9FUNG|nr:hypothetical protein H4R18_005619 [Coemansia javaensis]
MIGGCLGPVQAGLNIDTAVCALSAVASEPLGAAAVVVAAFLRGALASPWLFAYLALFVGRAALAWGRRQQQGRARTVDWSQQVVVLTGGAHGIGLELLQRLSAAGARVAVLDIRPALDRVPAGARYYRCDLTDAAQVSAVLDQVGADLGTATMLVNNAGTVCPHLLAEQSVQDVERVVRTNLVAPMLLTRHLLPGMLGCAHAHIVFVSSALAFAGVPQLATYTASKAGLALFYESLRLELRYHHRAPHVKTTALFPSKVDTGLFSGIRMRHWLSPRLSAASVADAVFSALERSREGEVYMPAYVNFMPLYMFAPRAARDLVGRIAGSIDSMRTFRGHGGGDSKDRS